MNEKENVGELSAYIDRYTESSKRTLKSLSSASNIPYSTLRRVIQNEVEPSLETVIQILSVVASHNEMQDYLEKNYPTLGNHMKRIQDGLNISTMDGFNILDGKRSYYRIMLLASTSNGLSYNKLVDLMGSEGIKDAEWLVENNLLKLEEKVFQKAFDYSFSRLTDILKEQSLCHDFIRDELRSKQKQLACIISEGVTESAQKQIHQELQACMERVTQIARENKGNLPIFFGALMGQVD